MLKLHSFAAAGTAGMFGTTTVEVAPPGLVGQIEPLSIAILGVVDCWPVRSSGGLRPAQARTVACSLDVVPRRAVRDPELLGDALDRHPLAMQLGDPPPGRLGDRRPAGPLALCLGPGHTGLHPLTDQGTLELGQVGHHPEHQLPLRRGRVHVLLVADEGDTSRLELSKRVDQGAGRASEAIVAPDEHDIELALARRLEELLVLGPRLSGAGGAVDELADHAEAATLGVLAQRTQLGLGVLAAVLG